MAEALSTRNQIEYEVAFHKPELLQKVVQQRDRDNSTNSLSNTEEFDKQLTEMFGKTLESSG